MFLILFDTYSIGKHTKYGCHDSPNPQFDLTLDIRVKIWLDFGFYFLFFQQGWLTKRRLTRWPEGALQKHLKLSHLQKPTGIRIYNPHTPLLLCISGHPLNMPTALHSVAHTAKHFFYVFYLNLNKMMSGSSIYTLYMCMLENRSLSTTSKSATN